MSLLREYIRELLIEEDGVLPKGQWVLLQPGDELRELIKDQLFGLVQTTYASVPGGRHFKISSPGSLDRYNYWVVNDLDEDPDVDVVMMGRPSAGGSKMGASANDGTAAAKSAYKDKSAELRKGGEVGGVGNWWGEVSHKPAYAMLSRGAPAIEDEAAVRALLGGKDITWHGQYPKPEESNQVFDAAKGWYTRGNGDHSAMKIIVGSPSI